MTDAIHTVGEKGEYLGEYIHPNRYEGNKFVPPQQTVASSSVQTLVNSLKFGAASAAIVSDSADWWGVKDILWGTWLSFKNKIYLRDIQRVQQVESDLSDKKYELGLWGGWSSIPNAANRKILEGILQSYVDQWLLQPWFSLAWVSYNVLTSYLSNILSATKTILYTNDISQFSDLTKKNKTLVKLVFAEEALQSIQDEYACANWLRDICDPHKTTFTTIWTDLSASLKYTFGKSWFTHTFTQAGINLAQFFTPRSKQTDAFIQKKNDLWQATYGKTTRWSLIDMHITQQEGNLSGALQPLVRSWKYITDLPSIQQEIVSANQQQVPALSSTTALGQDLFEKMLLEYVQDVFVNQVTDSNLATFVESKDITQAFGVLSRQIYTTRAHILGGKDQDGSLIKNLWDACELQCGGKWNCR